MNPDTFLAHISRDGRTQTLLSHLAGTATLAKAFAQSFDAQAQAEVAGLLHDIGKFSAAFQQRVRGDTAQVDHSTAGAYECWRMGQPLSAFAVAGHHGGLPDGGSMTDSADAATFLGRMRRAEQGKFEPYDHWKEEVAPPLLPRADLTNSLPEEVMFFTRMLYSCLVDADYLDTEAFMAGHPRAQHQDSIDCLWEKLQQYISGWFPPQGELNRQRCAILERCIAQAMQPPGLFSLTVPTGGGKTVASLAFAFAHAKANGMKRIIYVIPYTSIIEQTADIFRTILGDTNVLEHHSNVLYDSANETDAHTIQLAQATENWDMPVIVTTAVQFFESLFACRPSQCRKLHNLANSVIIFDEAQMLPLPYLQPCIYAISQLVARYHASAVLCTATQPALASVFREFLPQYPITELCPSGTFGADIFRRVTFRQQGRLTWSMLAEQLNAQKQVLCIVNTRKGAQALFRQLNGDGVFHLSTLMCPAHRQKQIAEIRRRLADGLPCRVVSTSLIEAGVDIDFPIVYRELTGLDSILQAAGRCNREGKRPVSESIVTIFQSEERTPPLLAAAAGAGQSVLRHYPDFMAPDAIEAYFRQLFDLKGSEAQDMQRILPTIRSEFLPFRTIADRFHLIDSPTCTIYVPYQDGKPLLELLRSGERSKSLYRQLGRYGVSVYKQHFAALQQAGDIEILDDGTAALCNPSSYSEQTGLSLDADSGKALFI